MPPPVSIDLWVDWNRDENGSLKYTVRTDRKNKLQSTVLDVVNTRVGNRGLSYLLVGTNPIDKCFVSSHSQHFTGNAVRLSRCPNSSM